MAERLVSPDRKLFLVAGEGDLRAVAELYNLTRGKQKGSIWQLLGCNRSSDHNDRTERKVSENFMLLHSVIWLRQDDCTEYVPLVGKLEQMFNSVVTPSSQELWKQGEHQKPAQWVEGAHWTMEKGKA